MKLNVLVLANFIFALITAVLACIFSGVSLSSLLPVFFPQFAVLVALLKYFHVRNVLRAADDMAILNPNLKKSISFVLFSVAVVIFGLAINFFHLDMKYKVMILISGDLAILSLAAIFIVLYPALVKLDAGIYKKVAK